MCRAAAAKKDPPKPELTWSDSFAYLSLAVTADRWIALIHLRKKDTESREEVGGTRGGQRRNEREKGPQDDSPALLSVQRAGVWLSATENNKPSTTRCSASLSLLPYLSLPLRPPSLSLLPFSSLNSFFLSQTLFIVAPLLLPLLYSKAPIPRAPSSAPHGLSLCFLSLLSPFQLSAISLYLPSRCICLSLSEVWETRVRGPCQTNQQHSLTAIPLWIWLCIWIFTAHSVATTTDTPVRIRVNTRAREHGWQLLPQQGEHVIGKRAKGTTSNASKQSLCSDVALWGWLNSYAMTLPHLKKVAAQSHNPLLEKNKVNFSLPWDIKKWSRFRIWKRS